MNEGMALHIHYLLLQLLERTSPGGIHLDRRRRDDGDGVALL